MNKKLRLAIIITAATLLVSTIIIVIIALSMQPDAPATTDGNTTEQTNTNQTTDSNTTTTTTDSQTNTGTTTTPNDGSNVVISNERTSITRAAISFTERYGSYSSDSNFENIEALDSVMTNDMKGQAANVVKNGIDSQEYYSISTQAVSVKFVDFVDGSTGATVEVFTRRTEQKGLSDPVIFSQTARLQLNKVDNQWKTDDFKWL